MDQNVGKPGKIAKTARKLKNSAKTAKLGFFEKTDPREASFLLQGSPF